MTKKILILEGLAGAGKSTVVQHLKEELFATTFIKVPSEQTREMVLAEKRIDMSVESFYRILNDIQNVEWQILLAQHTNIVIERFAVSTMITWHAIDSGGRYDDEPYLLIPKEHVLNHHSLALQEAESIHQIQIDISTETLNTRLGNRQTPDPYYKDVRANLDKMRILEDQAYNEVVDHFQRHYQHFSSTYMSSDQVVAEAKKYFNQRSI